MRVFWFQLIPIFLLIPRTLSSSIPKSNSTDVGKCDVLISKLVLYLHPFPLDFDENQHFLYQNITEICKSVTTCLGSLPNESAKKLKKVYDKRCERYGFYSYGMMKCFLYIIMDKYTSTQSKCNGTFNFTTTDLEARRKAFHDGKPCLMDIAKSRCHNISSHYLQSNYDKFVNILTKKPKEEEEEENCDSLFVDLSKYQCNSMRHQMEVEYSVIVSNKQFHFDLHNIRDGNDQCKVLKECSSDPCNLLPTKRQLEKCEVLDALSSDFNLCFEDHGNDKKPDFKECKNSKNKTECVRETMIKKCGNSSVIGFEKYYEWFKNNDLSTLPNSKDKDDDQENVEFPRNHSETGSDLGKCSLIVEDFVFILSNNKYIEPSEYYPKANEICRNTAKCYGSIGSEEAKKLKSSYEIVCDMFDFMLNSLFYCYNKFFLTELSDKKHSIENSNFFSWNLTVRREEFLSKKSYFMDFANKECTEDAKKYLKTNYEHFVNMATIKPENDDCKSVASITENYHCIAETESYSQVVDLKYEMSGVIAETGLEDCRLTKKCLAQGKPVCPSETTKTILNWCETLVEKGAYFYQCLEKLAKSKEKYSKHECVAKTVTQKERGEEFLVQFETNKNCLKEVMTDECGKDSVTGFEEYFHKVLQANQNTWK